MVHYLPRSYSERSFPSDRTSAPLPERGGPPCSLTVFPRRPPGRPERLFGTSRCRGPPARGRAEYPDLGALFVIGIEPTVAHIGGACAVTAASRPTARGWLASLAGLGFSLTGRAAVVLPWCPLHADGRWAPGGARVGCRHCGGQCRGPVRRAAAGPGRAPGPGPRAGLPPACSGRGIRRRGGVPPYGAADRPAAYRHGPVPSASHRAPA